MSDLVSLAPIVTKDARFLGARQLVEGGQVERGALDIFQTLIYRAEEEFGETSLDAAAVYYEYGNALFLKSSKENDDLFGKGHLLESVEEALDYMVKSCSILYSQLESIDVEKQIDRSKGFPADNSFREWINDQLPRNLIGLGRILSFQGKHADAVESFINAIPFREKNLDQCSKKTSPPSLRLRKLLLESYVYIAEELLLFPFGQDVVQSETYNVMFASSERIPQARFYYDRSREVLEDIVFLMAELEQENNLPSSEKEDICYLATMLIHLGMSLDNIRYSMIEQNEPSEVCAIDVAKKRKL